MALGTLLRQTDPRARAEAFNVQTRRAAKEGAVTEVLNRLKAKRNEFNPINTLLSSVAGFLIGGPVGAVAGAVTAPRGRTTPLRAAAGGVGAGGITGQLGGIVGADPGLVTGPATGALGRLTGGQAPTTPAAPGATPGISPEPLTGATTRGLPTTAGPAVPAPTFDLGRLVAPENIARTAPLIQGLVSGRPLEGLAAARQVTETQALKAEQKIDKELARDVTRAQLKKLEGEVEKGNFKFDSKTNTILNQDTGEITLGPAQLGAVTKDPNKVFIQEKAIRTEFNAITKDFRIVRDSSARVEASAKDPSPAGDLALIFNYMKILDPGSTVREGEFATAEKSGSVPRRIVDLHNRILAGTRLEPTQRADFLARARSLAGEREKQFNKTVGEYRKLTEAYDLDPNRVVLDFTAPEQFQQFGTTQEADNAGLAVGTIVMAFDPAQNRFRPYEIGE